MVKETEHGRRHERTKQKASINREGLSDLVDYAALLDQHWHGLAEERAGSGAELRYISREQLADAMCASALAAVDDCEAGDATLISAVGALRMQVTHLLEQPDLRLRHPSLDIDLIVADVEFTNEGVVVLWLATVDADPQRFRFLLAELHVAGPVNDAVRTMVKGMVGAVVGDAIALMVDKGKLRPLPDLPFMRPGETPGEDTLVAHGGEVQAVPPQSETVHHGPAIRSEWRCIGCKTVVEAIVEPEQCAECQGRTFAGVHHLQPHPSYALKDGELHAEPVTDICPGCHLPVAICACAEAG